MTDVDAETLKREWSDALVRWWFLPLLAAAVVGVATYAIALQVDPPLFRALTYIYMPGHDVADFRRAIDVLPADIERLPDRFGNQYLALTAPSFGEARDRLVAARESLDVIAEASRAGVVTPATAEVVEWVRKFQTQSVSVVPVGGGGEGTCVAIAWAFMLTVSGILFARSRKYDAEEKSRVRTVST